MIELEIDSKLALFVGFTGTPDASYKKGEREHIPHL